MDNEEDLVYDVVINDEEQYSIWRLGREVPPGWTATGFRGSEEACLSHIDEVWTDMRPKSLREQHEADGISPA